eukprot:CAMPEP_0171083432 /NCGR_PEP_ID=MMETSP0766_2-20121228/17704_1 /TAXON_ID=439317 /ORGANISM="Gambierdiscus australes, Strain CAWD 149" /LENGTH=60 /DNA_ID=CAMNT_0011540857 /DNA_START=29 /DNA_END=207 /DNA_ORIENTATION=-
MRAQPPTTDNLHRRGMPRHAHSGAMTKFKPILTTLAALQTSRRGSHRETALWAVLQTYVV